LGVFYGHSEYLISHFCGRLFFSSFGKLCQDKSGKPVENLGERLNNRSHWKGLRLLTAWRGVPMSPPAEAIHLGNRVARLGEISPIERLFTLGTFLTITKAGQIFGLLSFTK
jgi:hypothetical protein